MISALKGEVWDALPNRLTVGCAGVGYLVHIPISTFDRLNPVIGKEIFLKTHLYVRENAHNLYGFASDEERDLFLLLIERVSGIGPSIAMAILSGMPVEEFQRHVVEADVAALSRIKGLGKKTAERIILELKDKVGVVENWHAAEAAGGNAARDAELALIALGYKQAEARKAVAAVAKARAGAGVDELIREALRGLS
ncbi:Holliday junction branch migration protein RuvA [Roseibacillus ishigakijimensis]|uniref:Holliday junction branch migration complex subunit RuvA n=1 Tax=Roseibacillus ishigakijimensis TaxID=454146 RepID=A0A934RTM6_9BACT|nr:Holliday junction branch migration protein RuvA [Roseibacillus ishigakijimensis]MBK1834291.1 Holliday junction branch migration protein RuvA [Roseibacillus ishigakijimensis]